ncbi:restriction endonuclease subunit S [Streptosporangium saharense]|uniref:restriction endonuclease subunit S n=1 Tax=Streptosporangium saharense TaxID=1706840 RepID=UPI003324EB6E
MSGTELAPWLTQSKWPTVPIRYVARLGTGHTPSRQRPEYWEACTFPWVTLADVWQLRDGTCDTILETKEKISRLGLMNSAAVLHPSGTVILSRTASVGFSAIMGRDMATSQDFATWTCGPNIEPRYLLHALRAMAPDLRRVAAGSTHKTIYMPDIEQLRIPLPSIEVQRRIVEFLDVETKKIDQLTTLRRRQIDLIKERYLTEISNCVIPGIFADGERSDSWPWLPRDLETIRLGYLSRIQGGVTVDASRRKSESDVEVPYLRVANVQGEEIDLSEIRTLVIPKILADRSILRKGDVVMTEANGNPDNLGRGAVWDGSISGMVHQNHIFSIRTNGNKLLPEYLSFLLASVHGRRYFRFTSNQVGIATTSSNKVLSMPIPVLGIADQLKIVKVCASARRASDRAVRSLRSQLALLLERRQALITAAITGRVDVGVSKGR